MVAFTWSKALWWTSYQCQGALLESSLMDLIPMPGHLLGPFGSCDFGLTALSNKWGERGKHFAPSCPCTMPRKCLNCLTFVGGWITSISCTLLLWGLMPSLVSMYPRYSISSAQNVLFSALTFKPPLWRRLSTSSSFLRWSSRLLLEMQRRSSK